MQSAKGTVSQSRGSFHSGRTSEACLLKPVPCYWSRTAIEIRSNLFRSNTLDFYVSNLVEERLESNHVAFKNHAE
jgi:hypothetical protein